MDKLCKHQQIIKETKKIGCPVSLVYKNETWEVTQHLDPDHKSIFVLNDWMDAKDLNNLAINLIQSVA